MTGFVEFSSDSITTNPDGSYYSVSKWRGRKSWQLTEHGTRSTKACAYFRSEADARRFADSFDLTITDHGATP